MERQRPAHRILVLGYYGRGNAGDDALCHAFLRELVERLPDSVRVDVLAGGSLCMPAILRGRVGRVPWFLVPVVRSLVASDAIVLGGGTHFHDHGGNRRWLKVLLKYLCLFGLCRVLRKQIHLVGVGVGPACTAWGKLLIALLCRLADSVSVRDTRSLATVRALGSRERAVCAGFDLSALLLKHAESTALRPRKEAKVVIGVSILPYYAIYQRDASRDAMLAEALACSIRQALESVPCARVKVFAFSVNPVSAEGDLLVSRRLCHLLGSELATLVTYDGDPLWLLSETRTCDFFVASRLHASVFAYLAGVPQIMVAYHPKCSALAEDIGLPDDGKISIDEVLQGKLTTVLREGIANPARFGYRLSVATALASAERLVAAFVKQVCG